MIESGKFAGCLKEMGIDFFTGVPDSLLKSFYAYVTDTCGENYVIAANEGDWRRASLIMRSDSIPKTITVSKGSAPLESA